jgi:hypothetical protein
MKAMKTKLHQHRKSKSRLHPSVTLQIDSAEIWGMDHDHPDLDMQLYRISRSPKQENL